MQSSLMDKAVEVTLTLLRIVAGLLFMQHGAQKLFGWLGGTQVEFVSLMGLAVCSSSSAGF